MSADSGTYLDIRDEPAQPDHVIPGRHRGDPRLFSVPAAIRQGRYAVSARALWAVLLVVLVVSAAVVVRSYVSQSPAAQPLPEDLAAQEAVVSDAERGEAGAAEMAAPAAATGEATATPTSDAQVTVHVIGAVHEPGVYSLPAQSRVIDAIERAGGTSESAELSRINLALPIADGAQLWVPVAGEEPPEMVSAAPVESSGSGAAAGVEANDGADTVVDLNQASSTQLEQIPGIGPVTAQRIVAFREDSGGFTSVEQLLDVSGIGEKTLENLRPYVAVG